AEIANPIEGLALRCCLLVPEIARAVPEAPHHTLEGDGGIRHERGHSDEATVDRPILVGEQLDQVEEEEARLDARFATAKRRQPEVEGAVAAAFEREVSVVDRNVGDGGAAVAVRLVVIDERGDELAEDVGRRLRAERDEPGQLAVRKLDLYRPPPKPHWTVRGQRPEERRRNNTAEDPQLTWLGDETPEPELAEMPHVLEVLAGHVARGAPPASRLVEDPRHLQHERTPGPLTIDVPREHAHAARPDLHGPNTLLELLNEVLERLRLDPLDELSVVELARAHRHEVVSRPTAGQQGRRRGKGVQIRRHRLHEPQRRGPKLPGDGAKSPHFRDGQ